MIGNGAMASATCGAYHHAENRGAKGSERDGACCGRAAAVQRDLRGPANVLRLSCEADQSLLGRARARND